MAPIVLEARVKNLIQTEAEWLLEDPIILDGEIAYVRFGNFVNTKAGNGSKKFSQLEYNLEKPAQPVGILKPTDNPGPASEPRFWFAEKGLLPILGLEVTGALGIVLDNGLHYGVANFNIDQTEVLGKIDAVDDATKAAQDLKFINNVNAKWGVVDKDLTPLLTINANDELDAAGLSKELISKIKSPIYDLMFPNTENTKYIYGILDIDGRIVLGVDDRGRVVFESASAPILDNSRYLYAILDSEQKILFAILEDGTLEGTFKKTELELENLRSVLDSNYSILVPCFGDSLTQGHEFMGVTPWPKILQGLVGPQYKIINCGVGGETVPTISFRQGGVPGILTGGFDLPANTAKVEVANLLAIGNNIVSAKAKPGDDVLRPLLQGDGQSINPCIVDGVECTLTFDSNKYYLQRNVPATAPKAVPAGSVIYTKASRNYRKSKAAVYFMGQNGGYTSIAELVEYYKALIEFNGTKDYIIIGLHTGTPAERADLERLMLSEFGLRYFNLRRYFSTEALEDLGLTPTYEDSVAMAAGTFPPSLWLSPTDSVHANTLGNTAIANKVYNIFKQLGTF